MMFKDKLHEVRQVLDTFNDRMTEIFSPAWVSCLDESGPQSGCVLDGFTSHKSLIRWGMSTTQSVAIRRESCINWSW